MYVLNSKLKCDGDTDCGNVLEFLPTRDWNLIK